MRRAIDSRRRCLGYSHGIDPLPGVRQAADHCRSWPTYRTSARRSRRIATQRIASGRNRGPATILPGDDRQSEWVGVIGTIGGEGTDEGVLASLGDAVRCSCSMVVPLRTSSATGAHAIPLGADRRCVSAAVPHGLRL